MALVTQLRVMQETELDARRREVFPLIIAYIEAVIANKATLTPRHSGQMDTVRSLSGSPLKPGKGIIH